jgi:competence protein ComEA
MRSLVITADYQPVNVNEATASEIAGALRGVGLKTASAIVAYRKANGPFKTTQSLTAVKGIGNKTLLKNEGVIVFESYKLLKQGCIPPVAWAAGFFYASQ